MRNKLTGFITLLFGAADLVPAVREFVRLVIWDQVLRLMHPAFESLFGMIFDYGVPVGLVILGLYLLAADRWFPVANSVRQKLNVYLLFAGIFSVGALASIGGYFWDRSRGPIEWIFDLGSPLDWQRVKDGPLWIIGFQIKGKNRWDDPISPTNAYIRSDINARIVPLFIRIDNKQALVSDATIPGNVDFVLAANLPATGSYQPSQIPVSIFLSEFSRCTLVFEYEGGRSIHRFSKIEIENFVSLADRDGQRVASKPPSVFLRPHPANSAEANGPFEWSLSDRFLFANESNGKLFVVSAMLEGTNISMRDVTLRSAYVISSVAGERHDMKIGSVTGITTIGDINPIPPGAHFQLTTDFDRQGGLEGRMTDEEFIKKWGVFRFVVEYNSGETYTKQIDEAMIRREFSDIRTHISGGGNPPPARPQVTRRPSD